MSGTMQRAKPGLLLWLLMGSLAGMAGPPAAAAAPADLGQIEPAAVQQNRGAWVVLDARPKARWQESHVPGARSFSWEDYTGTDTEGIPYRVLPPKELAVALARLGVDERTPVVVYGDAESSWGGEGWSCWILAWLGHQGPIRLLAGGIQAWRDGGLPLAQSDAPFAPVARYQVNLRPDLGVTTEAIADRGAEWTLIDVRSTWEWIKGRIPGATHIPWEAFYQGNQRAALAPTALRGLLDEHGVDTRKPVVFYCTGGIRSAYAWLVYQLSGLPSAHNYEGGMEAWSRRSGG